MSQVGKRRACFRSRNNHRISIFVSAEHYFPTSFPRSLRTPRRMKEVAQIIIKRRKLTSTRSRVRESGPADCVARNKSVATIHRQRSSTVKQDNISSVRAIILILSLYLHLAKIECGEYRNHCECESLPIYILGFRQINEWQFDCYC